MLMCFIFFYWKHNLYLNNKKNTCIPMFMSSGQRFSRTRMRVLLGCEIEIDCPSYRLPSRLWFPRGTWPTRGQRPRPAMGQETPPRPWGPWKVWTTGSVGKSARCTLLLVRKKEFAWCCGCATIAAGGRVLAWLLISWVLFLVREKKRVFCKI